MKKILFFYTHIFHVPTHNSRIFVRPKRCDFFRYACLLFWEVWLFHNTGNINCQEILYWNKLKFRKISWRQFINVISRSSQVTQGQESRKTFEPNWFFLNCRNRKIYKVTSRYLGRFLSKSATIHEKVKEKIKIIIYG